MTSKVELVEVEGKDNPEDNKASTVECKDDPEDNKASTVECKDNPEDNKASTVECKDNPEDNKVSTVECKYNPEDNKASTVECKDNPEDLNPPSRQQIVPAMRPGKPRAPRKSKKPRDTRGRREELSQTQILIGRLKSRRQFKNDQLMSPLTSAPDTKLYADDTTDILCLHGWRSNSDVSRAHVQNLGLKKYFKQIDYLQGTTEAPGPETAELGTFFDGPFFSWIDTIPGEDDDPTSSSKVEIDELREALLHVVNHVISRGKEYDCAYGFSQGGAIVALLSMPAVLNALHSPPLWRRAILACSASSRLLESAEKALGISLREEFSWIPSLHVIGANDPIKPQSEMWLQRFEIEREADASCFRHTLYMDSAHAVSSKLALDSEFNAEVNAWTATTRSRDVPPPSQSMATSIRSLVSIRGDKTYRSRPAILSFSTMRSPPNEGSLRVMPAATEKTLLSTVQSLAVEGREPTCVGPAKQYNLSFDNQGPSLVICNATAEAPVQLSVIDFLRTVPEEAPFIRGGKGVEPLTYGALLHFIDTDGDMRSNGVTSPTVLLAYPAPTGPGGAITMLTISSQCTAAPFSPTSTHNECVEAMQLLKPQVLIAFRGAEAPGFVSAAKELGLEILWQAFDLSTGLFRPENPVPHGDSVDMLRNPADGVGMVLRTSGTTSTPKVVPLTAGALCANGAALASSLGLSPTDIALNFMPLFHIGGLSCSILATIGGGGSVICAPKFTPALFAEYTTQSKPQPTWYSSVPTIHLAALNFAKQTFGNKPPRHSLRFIRSGAAALSHGDALRLSEYWSCPVIPTYSMSEQMPISGKPIWIETNERANTVGQPVCSSMAICDSHIFRPVPFGTSGEICISGPNVVKAYRDNPAANAKSFFFIGKRRFFRTGDVGKFDDNAFLYLTGRIKELIKHGGEQVSPAEVEAAIRMNEDVEVAVVFGVPNKTWGEDIGAALILSEAKRNEIDADDAVRQEYIANLEEQMLKILSALKMPTYWHFAKHGELPMTPSKKYKRIGLAKVLGIQGDSGDDAGSEEVSRTPPTVSPGLNGLRYLLGVGVMLNHFGTESHPLNNGPGFSFKKSSYFPVTTFFILGGYTLAMSQGARPLRFDGVAGTLKFVSTRITPLLPLYYIACLFGLVNMLVTCWPTTYSDTPLWQPLNATAMANQTIACVSPPVSMPYWAMIVSTIVTFGLGLQSWPMFMLSYWLMYYLWYMSVYFFAILMFPMIYNSIAKSRGKTCVIAGWFIFYSVLIYVAAGVTAIFYAFPHWEKGKASMEDSAQNIYALTATLFPPLWVPSFAIGTAAYFLFDSVRPYESGKWVRYAVVGDILSVLFMAFHIAMYATVHWPYPAFTNDIRDMVAPNQNSGLKRYMWTSIVNRLMSPFIATWVVLISMKGKSLTSRMLEWSFLTKTLAATAYGCFLFHQPVGQWYFWITRGEAWDWFSYMKAYYWFSPSAMPSAWYEFPLIVGVVTVFSSMMNRVMAFVMNKLFTICSRSSESGQLTGEEIVHNCLARITGDTHGISDDATLDELGLSSVLFPILVAQINAEDQHAGIALSSAAKTRNVGELINLVDEHLERNRTII